MPIFTIYILMLALAPDGTALFAGPSTGPLVFKSFAACEVERTEVAKRNYPDARCIEIDTTKGNSDG